MTDKKPPINIERLFIPDYGEFNPWKSVWVHPRATIRRIMDHDPGRDVLILAAASSGMHGFWNAARLKLTGLPFLLVVILSPVLGPVILYLIAWLYRLAGRWLGGKAPLDAIYTAIVWPQLPLFVPFCFSFLILPFSALGKPAVILFIIIQGILSVAAGMWGFILSLVMMAEVQGFSKWKSFANLFLGNLFASGIAMLIAVAVFFSPLPGIIREIQSKSQFTAPLSERRMPPWIARSYESRLPGVPGAAENSVLMAEEFLEPEKEKPGAGKSEVSASAAADAEISRGVLVDLAPLKASGKPVLLKRKAKTPLEGMILEISPAEVMIETASGEVMNIPRSEIEEASGK